MATDDRIRTSDADRERVTSRLRDHFAEGRLTREELDERVAAALNARTFGDLRSVMADLPEPAPVLQQARTLPRAAGPGPASGRRGPAIMPLLALVLLGALLLPGGGWLFLALAQMVLVFWLLAGTAAIFAAARFRRRLRRWPPARGYYLSSGWPAR